MTLSSSSINVEWSAPSNDGGSPLTGFTVEYRPQTSSDLFMTESVGVDATEVVLSGLFSFVTYDVQVRAVNVIGSSQPNQILSAVTHPAGESVTINNIYHIALQYVYMKLVLAAHVSDQNNFSPENASFFCMECESYFCMYARAKEICVITIIFKYLLLILTCV